MSLALLSMKGISKSFGAVRAVQDVSLSLDSGEIRALVGENGAGKSTLIKILSGAISADQGSVEIEGEAFDLREPGQMLGVGIAVIYQEFAQAPHLSIAENISLGRLATKRFTGVDWKAVRSLAVAVLDSLGHRLNVNRRVGDLSVAERQIVEIARAVSSNARLIVLDEPSAVLGEVEISRLFGLMRKLRNERRVGFIYVSHRLEEVFAICDSVTILRDGRHIETGPTRIFDRGHLVRQMVGRAVTDLYPPKSEAQKSTMALQIENLTSGRRLRGVSLCVHAGEIVGLCGLSGAGRSEVLLAAAGADPRSTGTIRVFGKPVNLRSTRSAIQYGIGLVPEDRKTQGLCLHHSISFNMSLSSLQHYATGGVLRTGKEAADVRSFAARLRVKAMSIRTRVSHLSGGNQQKCLIGRQLLARTRILLIDEPTRGVDVGARREIYELLTGLARNQNLAILMVSSELPEALGLCDRIYVMREGLIVAELSGATATQEEIMKHAAQ